MTDKNKQIREFLDNIPDTFDILEEGVNIETQKEYLNYSHSFERGELTEMETINLGNLLFETRIPKEGKKKILTLLAHLGSITAFRQIEKYYKQPDIELKKWAALALQECKMFLESTLTDQNSGFIISGLGGVEDKLRYYFFVLPSSETPFTTTQKNIIKSEFELVAKDLNCVVETVDPSDTFFGFTALVPMDVALGTFIESGINKCKELGDFVLEHYYATNQDIPDITEIPQIIKKVME